MRSPTEIKRLEREAQIQYIWELHENLPTDPITVLEFELYAAVTRDIEKANEILREIEAS